MKKARTVECYEVEPQFVGLAERRTRAIVRAAFHDANPIRSIALSCYLQGIEDGAEAAWRNQAVAGPPPAALQERK